MRTLLSLKSSMPISYAVHMNAAAVGENGFTPLMVAASRGEYKMVKELLSRQECLEALNRQDLEGCTIWQEKNIVVRKLLGVETINVTIADDNGETPLIAACHTQNLDIVQELLMHERCLQAIDVRNSSGETALSIAKCEGYEEIVKVLMYAARTRDELGVGHTFSALMGKSLIPRSHAGDYRDRLKPVMVKGWTN